MEQKRLALIIEDNEDQRWIFSSAVEDAGYAVEAIEDGIAALGRLKEVAPHLVVLDLHIPGVPGKTILSTIRSEKALSAVFVILATADAQVADELRSQADLVLLKPISFFQLNQLAERFLKSPGRDAGKEFVQG